MGARRRRDRCQDDLAFLQSGFHATVASLRGADPVARPVQESDGEAWFVGERPVCPSVRRGRTTPLPSGNVLATTGVGVGAFGFPFSQNMACLLKGPCLALSRDRHGVGGLGSVSARHCLL